MVQQILSINVKDKHIIRYYQLTVMSYFRQNNRRNSSQGISQCHQPSKESTPHIAAQKKSKGESRHSYLKAFKKYYIDKLLEQKFNSKVLNIDSDKENFRFHEAKFQIEPVEKQTRQMEKQKVSIMTDSTKNSQAKSTFGKISQSKITNIVRNNDNEIEELLYGSISAMEKEMMKMGSSKDLAKENKMLKNSINTLKQVLKEKLEVALKKNKEELTAMFQEYSNMIKKLLEDKESLTNSIESWKNKYLEGEKRLQAIEQSYANQIKAIVEQNNLQTVNTKQQIQEFLEVIEQYEQEAQKERNQLENLRERLVELEMENDHLKQSQGSEPSTQRIQTKMMNNRYEQQIQKYASKIESLLEMLEELQNDNNQLKQFLKSCKCSRIQCSQSQSLSTEKSQNIQQVVNKYQKELIKVEKEYIHGEMKLREALAKKDDCIDRLNLVIDQLRVSRFASVDKITQEKVEKQLHHQHPDS